MNARQYHFIFFLALSFCAVSCLDEKPADENELDYRGEYLISDSYGSFNGDDPVRIVPEKASLQYSISESDSLQLVITYMWDRFNLCFSFDGITAHLQEKRLFFEKKTYPCQVTFRGQEATLCDITASGEISLMEYGPDPSCQIHLEGIVCDEALSFSIRGITKDPLRANHKKTIYPLIEWVVLAKDLIVNESGHPIHCTLTGIDPTSQNVFALEPGQSLEFPVTRDDSPPSLSTCDEAEFIFDDGKRVCVVRAPETPLTWPEKVFIPTRKEIIRDDHFLPEGVAVEHPIYRSTYILPTELHDEEPSL